MKFCFESIYKHVVNNTGPDTEFRTFCLVCLGSGVLLPLRFMKCGFLSVPFKIYSINIVDSTNYSLVLSVTGTKFL